MPGLVTGEREALDALGPVLCSLSSLQVSLSWAGPVGPVAGFYHVDWRDEHGRFFSGAGDMPSQAVEAAIRHAKKPAPLTRMVAGCVVDAEAA
jgi:hypothetical protein